MPKNLVIEISKIKTIEVTKLKKTGFLSKKIHRNQKGKNETMT